MNETLSVTLQAFDNMSSNLSSIAKYVNNLVESFERMEQQVQSSEQAIDNLTGSISKMGTGAGAANKGLSSTGETAKQTGTSAQTASERINELSSQLRVSSKSASIFDSGIGRIVKRVGSIMLVGKAFSMIGTGLSKALGRLDTFEVFRRNVTNFVGDAQKAEDAINSLNDYSTGTAYALDNAATMTQRMVTSGGKSIEESVEMTKGWMDIISTYGKGTSEELTAAGNALSKMLSKGKVNMLQTNTLTQTIGIPVVRAYAAAVGQSAEEVQAQLSSGEITAEQFEKTVREALLNGVDGFAAASGMAKIAGSTWEATMANSQNAVARGIQSIVDGVNKGFANVSGVDFKTTFLNVFKTLEVVLKDFGAFVSTTIPKVVEFIRPLIDMLNTEEGREKLAHTIESVVKSLLLFETLKTTSNIIGTISDKMKNLSIYAEIAKTSLGEALGLGTKLSQAESSVGKNKGITLNDVGAKKSSDVLDKKASTGEKSKSTTPPANQNGIVTGITGFSKVAGDIKNAYASAFSSVKKNALEGYAAVSNSGRQTAQGLKGDLFDMGQYAAAGSQQTTNAWAKSKDSIEGTFKILKDSVKNNINSIQGSSDVAATATQTVWQRSVNNLKEVFTGFMSVPKNLFELIKWGFSNLCQWIMDLPFVKAIQKVFEPLILKLKAVGEAIAGFVRGFLMISNSALTAVTAIASIAAVLGAITVGLGVLNADGTMATSVSNFFSNISTSVTNFGNNISKGISGFADKLNQPIAEPTQLAEGIATYGELYTKRGVELIGAFTMGIINSAGSIAATLIQVVLSALDGLIRMLPTFVSAGFKLIQSIITGIATEGPKILSNVLGWFTQTLTWVNQKLPEWIEAGCQLIKNVVQGIGDTAILLIQSVPTLIGGLVQTFKERGPDLIKQGMWLVWNLVKGLLSTVGTLVSSAIHLFMQFVGALTSDPMSVINAAGEIIGNFIEGIKGCVQSICDTAVEIGKDFLQWIYDGILGWWNDFVEDWNNLWNGWFGEDGQADKTIKPEVDNSKVETGVEETKNIIENKRESLTGQAWSFRTEVTGTEEMGAEAQQAAQAVSDATDINVDANLGDTSQMNTQLDTAISNVEANKEIKVETNVDLGSVVESAKTNLQDLQNLAQTSYDELVNKSSTSLEMVKQNTTNTLTSAYTDVQNQLNTVVDQYDTAMSGKINSTADQIKGIIQSSFATVRTSYDEILNNMVLDTGNKLQEMNNTTIVKINELKTVLLDLMETIRVEYQNKFQEISNDTVGIMQGLSQTLQNDVGNLVNQMVLQLQFLSTSIPNEFMTNIAITEQIFANFVNNLLGQADLLSNNFNKKVNDMLVDAEAAYATYVTHVEGKLSDLSVFHRQVGEEMMNNLRDGITSKTSEVIDATNELVEKMKEVFVKGLGIHSPSKWGYYVGQMTGMGVLNGLSDTDIAKFVEAIISNMKSSFENGTFNPKELVEYLKDDTLKVIDYLNIHHDETKGEAQGTAESIVYPLVGTKGTITSLFGLRDSPGGIGSKNHGGIDIAAPTGTPIVAALPGTVTIAGGYGGYGNAVMIDHGNGTQTLYGHMSKVETAVGTQVGQGQLIGLVGSTGNSTGPHLHFETRVNGTPVDPAPYLGGEVLAGAMPNTLVGAIQAAYNQWKGISPGGGMTSGGDFGNIQWNIEAGVQQWAPYVSQALSILGQSQGLLNGVLWAIQGESSGNPNSINLTDSNAAIGTPSKGLMQVIDPTFRQYAVKGYDTNIWDPLSNILAALNYMIGAYGSIQAVIEPRKEKWKGYKVGTRFVPYDMPAIIHEGEAILPKSQNPYSESGGDYLRDIGATIVEGARYNVSTINNELNNSTLPDVPQIENIINPILQTENGVDFLSLIPQVENIINSELEIPQIENIINSESEIPKVESAISPVPVFPQIENIISTEPAISPINPISSISPVENIINTEPSSSVSPQVSFGNNADLTNIDPEVFDVKVPTNTTNSNTTNNADNSTQNITLNVTNNNNVDGEKFINELENELHRLLIQGRQRRGGLV